jgi:hypothetical protein
MNFINIGLYLVLPEALKQRIQVVIRDFNL